MCLPLLAVAGIVAAAGAAAQGVGALQAGKANAQIAKREGQVQQAQSAVERSQFTQQRRAVESSQRVATAKSGRTMSGSVLDVVAGSERDIELDILSAQYGGVLGGQSARFRGQLAKTAGRNQAIGHFAKAGSNLLTAGVQGFG